MYFFRFHILTLFYNYAILLNGRVVLPIELRRSLNINEKDSLEIFVDDNKIILKKYEPADIFSGSMEDLIDYKGKRVSKASIEEMAKIIGLI